MEFSPESTKEELILNDLYLVGKNKPLGYLPLSTIEEEGKDIKKLKNELEQRGLNILVFQEGECEVASGAMYVYSKDNLQELLDKNTTVLDKSNWPKTSDEFILKVAHTHAPYGELFDLIADAFADYKNPGRSDRKE